MDGFSVFSVSKFPVHDHNLIPVHLILKLSASMIKFQKSVNRRIIRHETNTEGNRCLNNFQTLSLPAMKEIKITFSLDMPYHIPEAYD